MQALKVILSVGLFSISAHAQDVTEVSIKQEPMIQSAVNYAHSELEQKSHYSSNLDLRENRKIGTD